MNQEEHRKYWDSIAGKKKFTVSLRQDLFFSFVKRDAEILDFGCGYGRTLAELAEAGCAKLHGCDISPKMVAQAKNYIPSARVSINPGLIIPFSDSSFDCVIVLGVLTSIIADKDQRVLVKEIRRVLKQGGIVYVGDFLMNEDPRNLERYRQGETQFGRYGVFDIEEGAVLRHHDTAYIKQLFAGFDELKYETVVHQTMNGNQSNGFYFVGRNIGPSEEVAVEDGRTLQFPDLCLDDNEFPTEEEAPAFEDVPDEKTMKQLPGIPGDTESEGVEAEPHADTSAGADADYDEDESAAPAKEDSAKK